MPARASLVLVLYVLGCRENRTPPASVMVVDSVGVRIVETTVLPIAAAWDWQLDSSFAPTREFGDIVDVGVSSLGFVAALDRFSSSVIVLDSAGSTVREFGRKGAGPGEFTSDGLTSIIVRGDTVLVPDIMQQRVTAFRWDGTIIGTISMPTGDGLVATWTAHPTQTYAYRFSGAGGEVLIGGNLAGEADTMLTLGRRRGANTVLPSVPIWRVLGDGRLIVGWTDEPELRFYAGEPWSLETVVRWPHQSVALTEADQTHLTDVMRSSLEKRVGRAGGSSEIITAMLAQARFPALVPVLAGLREGPDGALWVQRARAVIDMDESVLRVGSSIGYGSNVWDIFEQGGAPAAVMVLPTGFRLTRIDGFFLYGISTDALGVQTVTRLVYNPDRSAA